jgi:hypothetical protein
MISLRHLRGRDLQGVAEGLAAAWLDAKMADIASSRAIYGIAAEFDLAEMMNHAKVVLLEAISSLLRAIPDARFADPDSAAFMLTALSADRFALSWSPALRTTISSGCDRNCREPV